MFENAQKRWLMGSHCSEAFYNLVQLEKKKVPSWGKHGRKLSVGSVFILQEFTDIHCSALKEAV